MDQDRIFKTLVADAGGELVVAVVPVVRSHQDSVIAAIALRTDATLVHNDVDFDRIAEVVTDLAVLRLPDR